MLERSWKSASSVFLLCAHFLHVIVLLVICISDMWFLLQSSTLGTLSRTNRVVASAMDWCGTPF